jgi:hypothetical protein
MDNPLLDANKLRSLKKSLRKINSSLAKMNTKDNSAATAEEVKQAVRSLLEPNDEVDSYLESAYITGCNLTTLSTQLLVAKALLKNPNEYGSLVQASDKTDKDFKVDKNFKTLKSFLVNTCSKPSGLTLSSSTSSTPSRSILEMFDSSDEDDNAPARKKPRKQTVCSEHSESSDFDCDFTLEQSEYRGKGEGKSKAYKRKLVECEQPTTSTACIAEQVAVSKSKKSKKKNKKQE